jgi:hypothetical protein
MKCEICGTEPTFKDLPVCSQECSEKYMLKIKHELNKPTNQNPPESGLLLLEKCFHHLGKEIERKTLNESANDGTQKLSLEIATFLDNTRTPPKPAREADDKGWVTAEKMDRLANLIGQEFKPIATSQLAQEPVCEHDYSPSSAYTWHCVKCNHKQGEPAQEPKLELDLEKLARECADAIIDIDYSSGLPLPIIKMQYRTKLNEAAEIIHATLKQAQVAKKKIDD